MSTLHDAYLNLHTILNPANARARVLEDSKKRVLELMSQLMADSLSNIDQKQVFDQLIAREKIGSTALGYGVALPHARIEGIEHVSAALIQLSKGVQYDAPDNQPVDLLVGLLVPENANEQHLSVLADLAALLRDESFRQALRNADSDAALYRAATEG